MKYKLSKREITLLYILLILLIIVCGWFFIIEPSFSQYNEKQIVLSEKQGKENTLKATYDDYKNAPKKAIEESVKYLENKEKLHVLMSSEDMDRTLTGMALLYGLTPYSLSIGEVEDIDVVSYQEYLKEKDKESSETIDAKMVKKVEVSMSLAGDIYNAFALADSIKDDDSMRLKSYAYLKGESVEKSQMNLVFDIYMVNE
ncbi:MAG: hypothetical protein EOM50_09055 [Erysipelotrichia bacterium]|nr:hypothetical protein [Erysipelotrichia bacterium]NCC53917.1 hypothetical protein [Erysipelotrichia bacterium]